MGARHVKFTNVVSSGPLGVGAGHLVSNESRVLEKGNFLKKFQQKPKTNALSSTKVVMAPNGPQDDEDDFEIDFGDAKPKL